MTAPSRWDRKAPADTAHRYLAIMRDELDQARERAAAERERGGRQSSQLATLSRPEVRDWFDYLHTLCSPGAHTGPTKGGCR